MAEYKTEPADARSVSDLLQETVSELRAHNDKLVSAVVIAVYRNGTDVRYVGPTTYQEVDELECLRDMIKTTAWGLLHVSGVHSEAMDEPDGGEIPH